MRHDNNEVDRDRSPQSSRDVCTVYTAGTTRGTSIVNYCNLNNIIHLCMYI